MSLNARINHQAAGESLTHDDTGRELIKRVFWLNHTVAKTASIREIQQEQWMQKIGLIGGMSWESTRVYYDILNQTVRQRLGGFHSARCVVESVDFAKIQALQHQDDWASLDQLMVESAQSLERAGADMILLCTNTMHLCSDAIIANTNIPFVHIADTTGAAIQAQGLKNILLLGTQFTMEKPFYSKTLHDKYAIETQIPDKKDRDIVHRIIFEELVHGHIHDTSRETYRRIIQQAQSNGAEGVILGCTEIPLLISASDSDIPVFDTTRLHAEHAVNLALQGANNSTGTTTPE